MDSIVSIIKKLRRFKGITQEAMAEKLHLSKRAYQKIESGQTHLDIDRLKQIAIVLDVSVTDLINAKVNTESHLVRFKGHSGTHQTGVQHILEEWTGRLLYVLIKAKGEEMDYLNKAVADGI